MISIETSRRTGDLSRLPYVVAKAHGVSSVFVSLPAGAREPEAHKEAAERIARLAMPKTTPEDVIVKNVFRDPKLGFAVWVAFDRMNAGITAGA